MLQADYPLSLMRRDDGPFQPVTQPAQGERWYVAHTRPRQEAVAQAQLGRQGFHTYLPWMAKTVRHARRIRHVKAPAFSRYIFVRVDVTRDRWRSINGTIGVAGLIMSETMPLPVPEGIVEALLSYTDPLGNLSFDRDLQPGQSVRLKNGPFAEAIGRLQSLDGKDRARVLLEIMNSEVSVTLQRSWLEAS